MRRLPLNACQRFIALQWEKPLTKEIKAAVRTDRLVNWKEVRKWRNSFCPKQGRLKDGVERVEKQSSCILFGKTLWNNSVVQAGDHWSQSFSDSPDGFLIEKRVVGEYLGQAALQWIDTIKSIAWRSKWRTAACSYFRGCYTVAFEMRLVYVKDGSKESRFKLIDFPRAITTMCANNFCLERYEPSAECASENAAQTRTSSLQSVESSLSFAKTLAEFGACANSSMTHGSFGLENATVNVCKSSFASNLQKLSHFLQL